MHTAVWTSMGCGHANGDPVKPGCAAAPGWRSPAGATAQQRACAPGGLQRRPRPRAARGTGAT